MKDVANAFCECVITAAVTDALWLTEVIDAEFNCSLVVKDVVAGPAGSSLCGPNALSAVPVGLVLTTALFM